MADRSAGDDDAELLLVLDDLRRRGAIGETSLERAVAHADRYVALLPTGATRLIDLGSGGGLPALVIARRRPALPITMVERRASRADQLRRAIRALHLVDHVRVVEADARAVAEAECGGFDVLTARSFAKPRTTATYAASLLARGGVALISEPPTPRPTAWSVVSDLFADHGVHHGIRLLVRR